jgi:hypothetical protein
MHLSICYLKISAVHMHHGHSAALGSQKDQSLNQHSAIQLFSCCSCCEQGGWLVEHLFEHQSTRKRNENCELLSSYRNGAAGKFLI